MDAATLAQPAHNQELVDLINNDPKSTWTAGVNERFIGATLADAKILMGTKQSPPESFLPARKIVEGERVEVPTEFDWRTDPRAAACPSLREIRDQANCGSCWAFGSVEAMTDRICIASKGKDHSHLSAADVTSCDHLGDMGCNGGIPSSVYTYYQTFGVVTGGNYGDKSQCYSYPLAPCAHHTNSSKYPACGGEGGTPKCARSCTDNTTLTWRSDKRHGTGGYSVCQQGDSNGACADAMMQEIYNNGPITGMFFVRQSFTSYKSGVYQVRPHSPPARIAPDDTRLPLAVPLAVSLAVPLAVLPSRQPACRRPPMGRRACDVLTPSCVHARQVTHPLRDPMLGGHAIKIMGYGTENGTPYWLVANSWNEDWGMGGYFKIKRGVDECQIENPVINGGPVAGHPRV
jgi:cathepsin B